MAKVCKRHADSPVMIYHQCVGCELEWFREELEQKQQEIKRLREEREKLIEGLKFYANEDNWRSTRFVVGRAEADGGERAQDVLKKIGVTVE